MISTPHAGEPAEVSGRPYTGHVLALTAKCVHTIWEFAGNKIDGEEALRRLGVSLVGTVGGIAITSGVNAIVTRVGSSMHPALGFVCQVAGNALATYAAEKLTEWIVGFFKERPEDAYSKACRELGIPEDAHRKDIKKAFAKCHPDKGSGLSNEDFEKKKMSFEFVKAFKNQRNTWDDKDEDE